MICKWCNREIQENSQFCPVCGKELNSLNTNNDFTNNLNNSSNLNANMNVNNNLTTSMNGNDGLNTNFSSNMNLNNNLNTDMNNGMNSSLNSNMNASMNLNNNVNDNSNINSNMNGNLNTNMSMNNNVSNQNEASYNNLAKKEDKLNIALVILSFIIPLVGLIVFIVKKDKEPRTAKVSGICALISTILVIAFSVIATKFLINFVTNYVDNSWQDIVDENNETIDNTDTTNNDDSLNNDEVNNNDTNNVVTGDVLTNDWQRYEVSINNKIITLPTTYNDLTSITGFSYKSADLKSYAPGGYYSTLNMYKNDKLALYVEALNDTDTDLLYTDCKITRISQSKYQVSQGADVVIFPGNLKAGDEITEAKVIELFGNPSDTDDYSSDGYVSKTYKYTADTTASTINKFHIKVVNGVIDELVLDHRN